MALPKDYIIQLVGGDVYQIIIDYKDDVTGLPINITGETVTMKFYSKNSLILTLASGTGLTITGASGRIQVDLTAAQTAAFVGLLDRKYVLRLDTSNTTILHGKVEVYQLV